MRAFCIEFNSAPFRGALKGLISEGVIKPVLCTTSYGHENGLREYVGSECLIMNNKIAVRACGQFFEKFIKKPLYDYELYQNKPEIFIKAFDMMNKSEMLLGQYYYEKRRTQIARIINIWDGILNCYNPEVIIFSETPHSTYSYVLYELAKLRNCKIIIFEQMAIDNRIFATNSIESLATYFHNNINITDPNKTLSSSLSDVIDKIRNDHENAKPKYMIGQLENYRQNKFLAIIKGLAKRTHRLFQILKDRKLTEDYFLNANMKVGVNSNICVPPSKRSKIFCNIIQILKILQIKKWYLNHANKNLPTQKFIFFPLHLQPEMTTSPRGGYFSDQLIVIDHLVSLINGTDIKLVVKEHPTQFNTGFTENSPRDIEFYKKILSYENVALVSTEIDAYTCINKSIAVATVTGTAGFEALVKGKKVIYYGTPWYAHFPGTAYGPSLENLSEVFEIMENSDLTLYAKAIDQFTVKADIKAGTNESDSQAIQHFILKNMQSINEYD